MSSTTMPGMPTTTTNSAPATATISAAASAYATAHDEWATAAFHFRFTQHIRKQAEDEYKTALAEEVTAKRDFDAKRRRADETEHEHKRLRSDAFREIVKSKGGASCGFGLLKHATAAAARVAEAKLEAGYELEDGEVEDDEAEAAVESYISFSPNCSPPQSPRCDEIY